jgi:rSAM/selenodomain-associated transferase 2
MPETAAPVRLSIVIPLLNEAESLPALLIDLGRQEGIPFEVILVDGGSVDGTADLAAKLSAESPFPCRVLQSEKGRGRQLNAGAAAARGDLLLFLHADSAFADPQALQQGVAALAAAREARGRIRVAGHFALRFARSSDEPSFAYACYEAKARLDRPECTHGDQGFLLHRDFFAEVGPFDETLPLLEDTRLAERIRREGEWLLLPAEIATSVRRFESEGLYERQALNAVIMNFAALEWQPFFDNAPGIYRSQNRTGRLRLTPFLRMFHALCLRMPWRQRLRLWYDTGTYVAPHIWQVAFVWDLRRAWRRGLPLAGCPTPILDACDRWSPLLTRYPHGRVAAALLVWFWYRFTLLVEARRICCRDIPLC